MSISSFIKALESILILLCFPGLLQFSLAAAKARHFKREVGYLFWSPDCTENIVMGINGQDPGPMIPARARDTIVVIHWHGIRQAGTYFYHGRYRMQRSAGLYGSLIVEVADGEKKPFQYDGEVNLLLSDWWIQSVHEQEVGLSSLPFRWICEPQFETPWANGTSFILQCPTSPEETFVYRFKVDKAGTYFYHERYRIQRSAGLYRYLIVEVEDGGKEPFHYDGEFNLSLSYWSHQRAHEQEVGLEDLKGKRHCTPHMLPNKTYRIRIASTTALASLNLAIGASLPTVVIVSESTIIDPMAIAITEMDMKKIFSDLMTLPDVMTVQDSCECRDGIPVIPNYGVDNSLNKSASPTLNLGIIKYLIFKSILPYVVKFVTEKVILQASVTFDIMIFIIEISLKNLQDFTLDLNKVKVVIKPYLTCNGFRIHVQLVI